MPCKELMSGLGKASLASTEQPQAVTNPTVALVNLSRLAISLVVTALIIILLVSPGGAQTSSLALSSSPEQQETISTLHARCLQDWDPGTHMTKKEWSGACQRLLIERWDYLRKRPL